VDLSLVDDRYAPDVLEVAARKAIAAWAEAVDGGDAALEAIVEPDAVQQMLYGSDGSGRTRLVIRGPRLEEVRILALDSHASPPSFTVEARVRGRRSARTEAGQSYTRVSQPMSFRRLLSLVGRTH